MNTPLRTDRERRETLPALQLETTRSEKQTIQRLLAENELRASEITDLNDQITRLNEQIAAQTKSQEILIATARSKPAEIARVEGELAAKVLEVNKVRQSMAAEGKKHKEKEQEWKAKNKDLQILLEKTQKVTEDLQAQKDNLGRNMADIQRNFADSLKLAEGRAKEAGGYFLSSLRQMPLRGDLLHKTVSPELMAGFWMDQVDMAEPGWEERHEALLKELGQALEENKASPSALVYHLTILVYLHHIALLPATHLANLPTLLQTLLANSIEIKATSLVQEAETQLSAGFNPGRLIAIPLERYYDVAGYFHSSDELRDGIMNGLVKATMHAAKESEDGRVRLYFNEALQLFTAQFPDILEAWDSV